MKTKKFTIYGLEQNITGFLREILEFKIEELEEQKKLHKLEDLQEELNRFDVKSKNSFAKSLANDSQISLICEIKKASPSLGNINTNIDVVAQARLYELAGASVISVLTDKRFFKGEIMDLKIVASNVNIPVLRKDFIIDPYQIYEAKVNGASAVLLVAVVLKKERLVELLSIADELGLKCLVEIHSDADLKKVLDTKAKFIGINSRDLQTFKIDLRIIKRLANKIPKDKIIIAESGIKSREDVIDLNNIGIKRFLVGTTLMQADSIKEKIKELKLI